MKHALGVEVPEDAVGCDRVTIRPKPSVGLTWARGRYDTPHGPIRVDWKLEGGTVKLSIDVPKGVTAKVWLADEKNWVRGAGVCVVTDNRPPNGDAGGRASREQRLALAVGLWTRQMPVVSSITRMVYVLRIRAPGDCRGAEAWPFKELILEVLARALYLARLRMVFKGKLNV